MSFTNGLLWTKAVGVVLWNGYSCYRAYKDFMLLNMELKSYWDDLRTYLVRYSPLFVKIAKATPPTWDDDIFEGIRSALESNILWAVVVKTLKQNKEEEEKDEILPKPHIERRRILQRLFNRNVGELKKETAVPEESSVGFGITEVLLILSIISSGGSAFKFMTDIVQWLRDRRTARRLRKDQNYDL
jgi:hypothetical protein